MPGPILLGKRTAINRHPALLFPELCKHVHVFMKGFRLLHGRLTDYSSGCDRQVLGARSLTYPAELWLITAIGSKLGVPSQLSNCPSAHYGVGQHSHPRKRQGGGGVAHPHPDQTRFLSTVFPAQRWVSFSSPPLSELN